MRFIKSKNLIRVKLFHNVPCDPFIRNVKDEYEAYAFIETQLDFLTFLNQDNPKDIDIAFIIEMFDDGEWAPYWNEAMGGDWEHIQKYVM